jgi:hypothetical protein
MSIQRTLLVLLVILPGIVGAQLSQKNKSKELGIMLGTAYYLGELNPTRHFGTTTRLSYGLSYTRNFTRRLGVKASGIYGQVEAWDRDSKDPYQINRNLNFRNQFMEFSAVCEINFFEYQANSEDWISPYLFGGMAWYKMNPQGYVQGGWIPLQPLGTEGQTGGGLYKLTGLAVPVGAGVKFNIASFLALSVEWGIRKTWTDYFDDVSTTYPDPSTQLHQHGQLSMTLSDPSLHRLLDGGNSNAGLQRGDPTNNDYYAFGLISLKIRLDKPANNCFK